MEKENENLEKKDVNLIGGVKAQKLKTTHDLTQFVFKLTDPLTNLDLHNPYWDIGIDNVIIDLRYGVLDLISGKYCATSNRLKTAYNLSYALEIMGEKMHDDTVVQIAKSMQKEISKFAYSNGLWI